MEKEDKMARAQAKSNRFAVCLSALAGAGVVFMLSLADGRLGSGPFVPAADVDYTRAELAAFMEKQNAELAAVSRALQERLSEEPPPPPPPPPPDDRQRGLRGGAAPAESATMQDVLQRVAKRGPGDPKAIAAEFQKMYEGKKVHQRQRFFGVRLGQDPFDALVIQEMLFDVKPDLIIETGTNSGGSALYMATLMAHINPGCKIVTIDTRPVEYWGGRWKQATDPTERPEWKERVTFIQGFSTNPAVVSRIEKEFLPGAKTVFVLLDSGHDKRTVLSELKQYNRYVTLNSYLLTEDTWLGDPGVAVAEFLGTTDEFVNDPAREHLEFTQHRGGFLKRVKEAPPPP